MCGIAGTVGISDSGGLAARLASRMPERGPDGSGNWTSASGHISFSHRRLAIIDLDERSAQPMLSRSGRYAITFNGEVYNYRSIRDELQRNHGFNFVTEGDTEVILAGFEQWGVEVFSKLNGMFAFALADLYEDKVYLCRDRLGVKPLYYVVAGQSIVFASQMGPLISEKAVALQICADAVTEYLHLGYVRSPRTVVKEIAKVPPGSFITIDKGQMREPTVYWNLKDAYQRPPLSTSIEAISEELEALLTEAFRLRMVSDVPVGLFLSGGIDSTLLATILVRNVGLSPKAYTLAVGDPQYDESSIAQETARLLGIEHAVGKLDNDDLVDNFACLPNVFDEPLADSSCMPTLSISQYVATERKVVLSADGADEVFGGYRRYLWATNLAKVRKVIPASLLRRIARLGSANSRALSKLYDVLGDTSELQGFREWNAIQPVMSASQLVIGAAGVEKSGGKSAVIDHGFLSNIQYVDLTEFLVDDILVKIDRATMHHSLEGREPFLDYRLVEFAARCPSYARVSNGKGKVLLREILRRHGMSHVLNQKKRGFSVPIRKWMGQKWKPLIDEHCSHDVLGRYDWLDVDAVERLRATFAKGDGSASSAMYALLVLLRWADHWKVT